MTHSRFVFASCLSLVAIGSAAAQHTHADLPAGAVISDAGSRAMAAHMVMTHLRPATTADSVRAAAIAAELRTAIEKYRNVKRAEADGFKLFAPQIKNQRVYHFTKGRWAIENQFRFNPAKPTSLLYRKGPRGNFILIGAMYTAPRRYSVADLDKRVPTSIAQWHKHVNWCVPERGSESRWTEVKNGRLVFGLRGVHTRAECESAGGRFHEQVFGWMVHANVFEQDIWGDHQMRGDELGMQDR